MLRICTGHNPKCIFRRIQMIASYKFETQSFKIKNRNLVKDKKKVQQFGITAPETKHTPGCKLTLPGQLEPLTEREGQVLSF